MKSAVILVLCVFGVTFANTFPFDVIHKPRNYDNIPQCLQPPKQGMCLAYFRSYYYNASNGTCQEFIYGGCQGNKNRFVTFDECMEKCKGVKAGNAIAKIEEAPEAAPAEEVCSQPKQPGLCYAYLERYYFNGKECELFIYGGCSGNKNNFETVEECNKACTSKPTETVEAQSDAVAKIEETPETPTEEVCSQPKTSGLCYAYLERFYFNGKECEQFVYGGCNGNKNNFETVEDCNKACPSKALQTNESKIEENQNKEA